MKNLFANLRKNVRDHQEERTALYLISQGCNLPMSEGMLLCLVEIFHSEMLSESYRPPVALNPFWDCLKG